ncbi:MAG TPA: AMP-binding protein, partial [Candidatus Limnocylindria bacterium]
MSATSATFNLAAALLDTHLEAGRGGLTALRYDGDTYTYADVSDLVARVGRGLRELGVQMEERVALLLPDSPQFVASFLGAIRIGAVPVTLSTLMTTDDYAYLLSDCRARAVFAHASVRDRVAPLRERLPHLRHWITAGDPSAEGLTFADLTRDPVDPLPAADTTEDDMAFWQYSSGTTGRPKAVVHLHGNAARPADLHGRLVAEITSADRILSLPKLFFSFGLNNSCIFPFRHGASAILVPDRPDPARVLDVIARERPTILYHVPTGYAGMLAAIDRGAAANLSSVRRCISAGEALPAPIYERWRDR